MKTIVILLIIFLTSCGSKETVRIWPFSMDANEAVETKLQTRITIDYNDVDFEDVIQDIRSKSGLNIIVEPIVMAQGVGGITLKLDNVRVGTVIMYLEKVTERKVEIIDDIIFWR